MHYYFDPRYFVKHKNSHAIDDVGCGMSDLKESIFGFLSDFVSMSQQDTQLLFLFGEWPIKAQANPQHHHMFPANQSTVNTRFRKPFREYQWHSAKYFNSAVPAMALEKGAKKSLNP